MHVHGHYGVVAFRVFHALCGVIHTLANLANLKNKNKHPHFQSNLMKLKPSRVSRAEARFR